MTQNSQNTFDFIIIGAGSAGCVLAERLSANGKYTVLVVEAGGTDRRFWVQVPLGYGKTFYDKSLNWGYKAARQGDRRLLLAQCHGMDQGRCA